MITSKMMPTSGILFLSPLEWNRLWSSHKETLAFSILVKCNEIGQSQGETEMGIFFFGSQLLDTKFKLIFLENVLYSIPLSHTWLGHTSTMSH